MANLFHFNQKDDNIGGNAIWELLPTQPSQVSKVQFTESDRGVPKALPFYNQTKQAEVKDLTSNAYSTSRYIDVVRDFDWTVTPKNNAGFPVRPPSIELIERSLLTSTFLAQFKYYTQASLEGGISSAGSTVNVLDTLARIGQNAIGRVAEGNPLLENIGQGIQGAADSQTLQNIYNRVREFGEDVSNTIDDFSNDFIQGRDKALQGVLQPYDSLYFTQVTGFVYNFPYFSDTNRSITNAFNETFNGVGGIIPNAVRGLIYDTIEFTSTPVAITEPGTFVEKPKFYQFDDTGETFSFSFPLINTLNPEHVSENYQLIWMLTYQNRPYRRNRVLINPTKIYTVNIPGVRYVPFAFISNLEVQFVGTRREVEIDFPRIYPSGGVSRIRTIIPEAYNVNISITSLTNESANFMIKNITDLVV